MNDISKEFIDDVVTTYKKKNHIYNEKIDLNEHALEFIKLFFEMYNDKEREVEGAQSTDDIEWVNKQEILEILNNTYLLPFRKEERLRGLKGIHGAWLYGTYNPENGKTTDYIIPICSVCGKSSHSLYADIYEYCPRCGAKMDRGRNE